MEYTGFFIAGEITIFPQQQIAMGLQAIRLRCWGGWVVRRFWKIPTKLLGGTRRFQVGSKREKETKVPEKVVGKWMRSQLSSQSCTQCSHCWGIAHKRAFFLFQKRIARGTRRLVCQAISVHQNAGKRHVIFHKLRGFRSAADSKLEALPRISVFFPRRCCLLVAIYQLNNDLKKYVPCAERSEFARLLDIFM